MRAIKLTFILFTVGLGFVLIASAGRSFASNEAAQRNRARRAPQAANTRSSGSNYSKFSHNVAAHRQACDACHKFPSANWNKVRTGDAAFPDVTDYPQHPSCIGCHRQQFFSGAQPAICTICHTNPSPRDSSRHPFPNPPEIFRASKKGETAVPDFGISFPHEKHVDIVGEYKSNLPGRFIPVLFKQEKAVSAEPKAEESEPKSCAVCHKTYQPQGESDDEYVTKPPRNLADDAFWMKKGTFRTKPTHATCFTCHAQDGVPPTANDCATCHKLLSPAQKTQLASAHDDFDPKLAASMGIKDRFTLERW
jgi:hypothetical protein